MQAVLFCLEPVTKLISDKAIIKPPPFTSNIPLNDIMQDVLKDMPSFFSTSVPPTSGTFFCRQASFYPSQQLAQTGVSFM